MSKVPEAKVEFDKTCEALLALGLEHAAAALPEMISMAVKEELAPHRFLDELLSIEIHHGEQRRVRTSLRLSALPVGQTLASFANGRPGTRAPGRLAHQHHSFETV